MVESRCRDEITIILTDGGYYGGLSYRDKMMQIQFISWFPGHNWHPSWHNYRTAFRITLKSKLAPHDENIGSTSRCQNGSCVSDNKVDVIH